MERLTKYGKTTHENGVCCTHFRSKECNEVMGNCAWGCKWEEDAWSKLAHYEDLEEQGLLLKLPCKVGDVVYYFSHRPFNLSILPNTIYEANVVRIVTTRLGTSIVIQIRNEYGCTEVPEASSFGKTVFLTREEAEAKLKESE